MEERQRCSCIRFATISLTNIHQHTRIFNLLSEHRHLWYTRYELAVVIRRNGQLCWKNWLPIPLVLASIAEPVAPEGSFGGIEGGTDLEVLLALG